MILNANFFHRDALEVAPDLIGKVLVRKLDDNAILRVRITETEVYRGEEDKSCHARFGKTPRSIMLYRESGLIYVYMCYGIHYLMNIITGEVEQPQGVLIRAGENLTGPAKLTKYLQIDKSFNGQTIYNNSKVWIENDGYKPNIVTAKRIGIDYAGEEWANKLWRYISN